MNKILLFITIASITTCITQAQDFEWAKSIETTGPDDGASITTDATGNIYTTGYFSGTADFDPGAGTHNITAAGFFGYYDIFVQKLDANGNFLWVKRIGGTNNEYVTSITTDATNNLYITGLFEGTVDFDPGAGIYNLTSAGSVDIFVLKLDANGNFLWAKSMGGTSPEHGYSITTDASGNVYTTGSFQYTADFDPGTGSFNLTSVGGAPAIFISKLDANGNFLWAKGMGGTVFDSGISITTDASGNVYTTGIFEETVDFDPGAGTYNLTSAGSNDIFVLKLDANGNFLWVKSMGGTSHDRGESVTTDASGNVYTTGWFEGTVDFDPGTGTHNLTSAGINDIFVQKLDANGNFLWVKRMGGTNYDGGVSIKTDVLGNVYTTGSFRGTADFDPGTGIYNLTSAGDSDIFVLKLDANGNFLWVKRMGGASSLDGGYCITTDASGNVYTTGRFEGTADFDPETGTHNLTSAGFTDIFIHKMSPCFITGADVLTACDNYTWIDGNTYTASNNTASFNIVGGAVNGCDSLVTLDLTINSLPTVSTTTSGTTITVDQANATYQWLDCDNGNAPISGETGQSFTATQNGNYAVIVDNGNCSATSACVTIATVGLVENVGLTKQIEVYPNPTTENLTLNLGSIAMGTIEIYNYLGKQINSHNITTTQETIKLTGANGVYFIKVNTPSNSQTIKVVKL